MVPSYGPNVSKVNDKKRLFQCERRSKTMHVTKENQFIIGFQHRGVSGWVASPGKVLVGCYVVVEVTRTSS